MLLLLLLFIFFSEQILGCLRQILTLFLLLLLLIGCAFLLEVSLIRCVLWDVFIFNVVLVFKHRLRLRTTTTTSLTINHIPTRILLLLQLILDLCEIILQKGITLFLREENLVNLIFETFIKRRSWEHVFFLTFIFETLISRCASFFSQLLKLLNFLFINLLELNDYVFNRKLLILQLHQSITLTKIIPLIIFIIVIVIIIFLNFILIFTRLILSNGYFLFIKLRVIILFFLLLLLFKLLWLFIWGKVYDYLFLSFFQLNIIIAFIFIQVLQQLRCFRCFMIRVILAMDFFMIRSCIFNIPIFTVI